MAILSDRSALTTPASGDLLFVTDVSDTTDAATGTDKKMTFANLQTGVLSAYAGNTTITTIGTLTAGNVSAALGAASSTFAGKVELATATELLTETDTGRAVTPAAMSAYAGGANILHVGTLTAGNVDAAVTQASSTAAGKVELAVATELVTGTDTARAVTPAAMSAYAGGTGISTVGTITAGTWNGTAIGNTYLPDATSSADGVVELALASEVATQTDVARAVTPGSLSAFNGSTNISALGTVTTGTLDGVAVRDLAIDVTPDTDATTSGFIHSTLSAAAGLSAFECVYVDSNSRWAKTDASATATADKLLGVATVSAAASAAVSVALPNSYIRNDAWNWTVGSAVLLSETEGALTQTAPTATDAVVRVVGYAVNADTLYFNPETGVVHA